MADMIETSHVSSEINDDGLEGMKEKVTNRLQKREDERLAEVQKRKEAKEATAAKNESLSFFETQFLELRSEIEKRLEQSDKCEKGKLHDYFDSLLISVQKLQKITTDSVMFLPSYEIQKSQSIISALQKNIQEKRDILIPRKKFAFKSKKKVVSETTKGVITTDETKKELKVSITECNFSDVSSECLVKEAKETNDKDVALARLGDCTVKIYGHPRAIHIDHLKNCKIFTGPVSGSIFMDNCENCTLVMACQQLRIHHTTNSHFYIHVTSKAIIEDCINVEFAPYNWHYDGIDEHYHKSGLDRNRNNWDSIDDFNWLAADAHSPNWKTLEESKRVKSWDV